jgi:hypothetical protein
MTLVRKVRYYCRLKYSKNKILFHFLGVYFVDYYHTDDSLKHFYDNIHSVSVSILNRFAETCHQFTVLICFGSYKEVHVFLQNILYTVCTVLFLLFLPEGG